MSYVPLWTKSNYSFLEGASHPWELVIQASKLLGLPAIALTDRDGVYGIVRAHIQARETPIKVIYGSQVSVAFEADPERTSQLVLLASDRNGYRNLGRLLTKGRLRCEKGSSVVWWEEVAEHARDVVALWGGEDSLIVRDDEEWRSAAEHLTDAFGDRLYAMVARHHRDRERAQEGRLLTRARELELPCVAANEVLYHAPPRRRLQDVLTCIRHKTNLADAGDLLKPNGLHHIYHPEAFDELFHDHPDWVARTREIASRCDFSLDEIRYVYPSERLPDGTTSGEWLAHLAWEGAQRRYRGRIPDDVRKQIEYELEVIEDLDYAGYFLTMYEIVDYCRRNEILCQGRGSAANSAVCFCLGITAIDPVKLNLLFERFISRERAEPPDIDLDISHERREEVIQHVYEKYGRSHAAMVANFVRYRPKSAIREVGKALGIEETTLDRAAKMLSHYDKLSDEELAAAGLDLESTSARWLRELTREILDFPRHLSIHPGGFLLGHEAVHDLVPIENATMADRTVIQWDKYDVEDIGLFKVDLLGLGALTQLDKGFDLIENHREVDLDMATIPHGDEATYDMICAAKTVGVFQIESRAQMAMLPRLRPREFYDLVIEVGIVRPGPITGDMVHPYLRRRNGEEPVTYPHPSLEPVLKKTLGIPLFQEQVMKLAVVAADYTPGEADQLRRDMAAWRSSGRLEKHEKKIISRMVAKGIELEFAERVYQQIRGFGEYGFPESHSASFALITYATCFMKCHYPTEFACSLLNSQPMGFYTPATIVDEAKREGVPFLPISIESSDWDCILEPWDAPTSNPKTADWAVRMGLRYIKGLREDEALRIIAERTCAPFESIRDFVVRTHLSSRTLELLAQAGALDCFGFSRRHALWAVQEFAEGTLPMPFDTEPERPDFAELTPFESIAWDYQTSFHSARGHPMQTIRGDLEAAELPDAATFNQTRDGRVAHYAGMVICRQRPGTAKGVIFMTLEDETGFVNVVVWPPVFEQFRLLVKTRTFIGITGRVQNQRGIVHLVADRFWVPEIGLTPPNRRSRDFH